MLIIVIIEIQVVVGGRWKRTAIKATLEIVKGTLKGAGCIACENWYKFYTKSGMFIKDDSYTTCWFGDLGRYAIFSN